MINLVTKSDFAPYKYFANSIKSEQSLDQCIQEAQLFDIKKWIGDALLKELCDQSEVVPTTLTTLNSLLLNGCDYTYNSVNYTLTGLKSCICYYALSRYIRFDSVKLTAVGVVKKEDIYSSPVDDKTIHSMANNEREKAEALRLEIILYLNRFSSDYPLWNCHKKTRNKTYKLIGQ